MRLSGKTRGEVDQALADKTRAQLVDLIYRLVSVEQLLTAREIAEASGMARRDVLRDMKAGRFIDPIFGRGFFVLARNSFKVSASAVNAWRESRFHRPRAIPGEKDGAPPETDLRREKSAPNGHLEPEERTLA